MLVTSNGLWLFFRDLIVFVWYLRAACHVNFWRRRFDFVSKMCKRPLILRAAAARRQNRWTGALLGRTLRQGDRFRDAAWRECRAGGGQVGWRQTCAVVQGLCQFQEAEVRNPLLRPQLEERWCFRKHSALYGFAFCGMPSIVVWSCEGNGKE